MDYRGCLFCQTSGQKSCAVTRVSAQVVIGGPASERSDESNDASTHDDDEVNEAVTFAPTNGIYCDWEIVIKRYLAAC